MIKSILKLPIRILKRILKGSSQPDPAPPTRPPPPPQPEPPQWMKQDHEHSHDHGHSHDHSHSHDHGHSHDHEHNHGHSDEQKSAVDVHTEDTPNPNARKYVISGATISESFSAAAGAQTNHALAKALVAIEGVSSVFGINDFVTVTKTDDSDWQNLDSTVMTVLKEHL